MPDQLTGVWMAQAEAGVPVAVRAQVEEAKSAAERAFQVRLESAPYAFVIDRFDWRPGDGDRKVLWAIGEGDQLATGYTVSWWMLADAAG